MDSYSSKLLELLAVYSTDRPQIKVRLTLEEKIELIWDVDQALAEHLSTILQLGEHQGYRYRLSFTSFWDSSQSQYYSSLTRTYRDHSDAIFFPCTEQYVAQLHKVKQMTHENQLKEAAQPWLVLNLPAPIKEKIKRFKLVPVAAASIAVVLAFGLTSYFYFNPSMLAKSAEVYSAPAPIIQEPSTLESIPLDITKSYELAQQAPMSFVSEIEPVQEIEAVEHTHELTAPKTPFLNLTDLITYRVPDGTVALTFDDGPSEYTKEIADILLENNIGGTFFFLGDNVLEYPDSVAYVANNDLSVGNHSYNHRDYTKMPYEEQEQDLLKSREIIEDIISAPVTLFRPPYGANNHDTFDLMETSETKMVLWNNDPEDWKHRKEENILEYITSHNASGAIILLHETKETVKSLPRIIEYLREQDLEIVNLR